MEVSLIIPVYNAMPWLSECIDSVLAQTYRDIELILVDDGSTDSSGGICDKYAAKDSRVKVIHTGNHGQAHARNVGLDNATGRYILFVDADDMIHHKHVETLLKYAGDDDIVNSRLVRGIECHWQEPTDVRSREYQPIQAIRATLYQNVLDSSPCGKLFPAHIFKKERFTDNLWYEDLDIICRLYEAIGGKVIDIDVPLYFYRQNPKSFINTFNTKRLDVLKVTDRIEQRYRDDDLTAKAARDRKFSANCNMYILSSKAGMADVADACWQVIRQYRTEAILNPKVRLKNKVGALLSYLGRKALLIGT